MRWSLFLVFSALSDNANASSCGIEPQEIVRTFELVSASPGFAEQAPEEVSMEILRSTNYYMLYFRAELSLCELVEDADPDATLVLP